MFFTISKYIGANFTVFHRKFTEYKNPAGNRFCEREDCAKKRASEIKNYPTEKMILLLYDIAKTFRIQKNQTKRY